MRRSLGRTTSTPHYRLLPRVRKKATKGRGLMMGLLGESSARVLLMSK